MSEFGDSLSLQLNQSLLQPTFSDHWIPKEHGLSFDCYLEKGEGERETERDRRRRRERDRERMRDKEGRDEPERVAITVC